MSTLNEGTLAAQPKPGAATESGTGALTGSEPSYSGDSNDGAHAALVRVEGFLKSLLSRLEGWVHIADIAEAKTDATNALAHVAEGKALAQGDQPSGAAAEAGATTVTQVNTSGTATSTEEAEQKQADDAAGAPTTETVVKTDD